MRKSTTVMLPGIKAEKELVERLNETARDLAISKSEVMRRALTMFLDAPLQQQQRDTDMEALVRRLVDERLDQREMLAQPGAA